MEKHVLKVKARQLTGSKVSALREQDEIPAVVYGSGSENINISLDRVQFEKLFKAAGESTLIDLEIEGGETVTVLIHDFQKEQISQKFSHVDFYKVDMTKKIKAEVELEFIGEAPAIKEFNGNLVKTLDSLEISSLPGNLPHHLEVNLENLKTLDDTIRVSDIQLPEGVEAVTAPETTIAFVEELKVEEEPEPVVEAEAAEGETEEGGEEEKKDQPAEGDKPEDAKE